MLASFLRRRLPHLPSTDTRFVASKRLNATSAAPSEPVTRRKRVIFSGIQPTGIPHVSLDLSATTLT
jgi:hypothetical protein